EGTQRQGQRSQGLAAPVQRSVRRVDGGVGAHGLAVSITEGAGGAADRLSLMGSGALGPALSAMMAAMRASTAGSSPALGCFGCGTLRTAIATSGPDESCTSARTVAESPTRNGCALSSAGSNRIRTGKRCTILIQLPEAFCEGSR